VLALILPAALLGGAYISQYMFDMYPCEMCWWQRWPHFAALAPAVLAFVAKSPGMQRMLVALAAFAIFTSGVIGGFHAGVEYGWWEGLTSCSSVVGAGGGDILENLANAPLVRCDVTQWDLFGISLAGFNFLLSCSGAIAILTGIWRNHKN
jgi:disulfide bond formation protein DsbB